ncbi:MAG: hypothetical protein AB1422_16460 [bacterium]
MEICCFPQSISTYFYKFQSISIILSPYHSYLLIPFLTLLIYSLNGYNLNISSVIFPKSLCSSIKYMMGAVSNIILLCRLIILFIPMMPFPY